ncbi:hypothetical protein C8R47DRAFT_137796 [Mycena vitilis]|nr:hypothetical protein C8R47DRAFT_137796 [Mycena vitilis]
MSSTPRSRFDSAKKRTSLRYMKPAVSVLFLSILDSPMHALRNWCLLSVLVGPVVALTAVEVLDTLNNLTAQAHQNTVLFSEICEQNLDFNLVVESKNLLDKTASAYHEFSSSLAAGPGAVVWGETVSGQILQAAEIHSQAFSTMGIALARALPEYEKHGYYLDGCKDGVSIGLEAITLFANLAVKFSRDGITLLLNGLAEVLRVPLAQLSALGCFVPIL